MKTVGRLPWIPPGTGHMNIAFTCHLLLLLLDLLCICPEAGMAGLCTTQLSADLVQALLQSLLTLLVRCLEWGRRRRAVRRKRNWALISKEVEEDKVFNMTEVSPVWLVFGLSFKNLNNLTPVSAVSMREVAARDLHLFPTLGGFQYFYILS
jgi:hypothetical protein